MVLSELIEELQIRLKFHGDLPVYHDDDCEVSGTRYLEAEERLSTCCGCEEIDDSDICEFCKEHADFEGPPERIYLKS